MGLFQKCEESSIYANKMKVKNLMIISTDAEKAFDKALLLLLLLKSLQSCPTLCDPIDGSPPGCPVPGILQARTLEWVAISFSNPNKADKEK